MALHPHEEATIRAFFAQPRRRRFLELLTSAKRRREALRALEHFSDWDERYARSLGGSADVVAVLRAAGAPDLCHVLSADPDLDRLDLPLRDAVDRAESSLYGSVLCCDPGRLALFIDEPSADRPRVLLRRDAGSR